MPAGLATFATHFCSWWRYKNQRQPSFCFLKGLSQIFLLPCSKIMVLNCQQTSSIVFLQILIFLQIPSKKKMTISSSHHRTATIVAGKPEMLSESALLSFFFMECALCLSIFSFTQRQHCAPSTRVRQFAPLLSVCDTGWSVDYSWLWFLLCTTWNSSCNVSVF